MIFVYGAKAGRDLNIKTTVYGPGNAMYLDKNKNTIKGTSLFEERFDIPSDSNASGNSENITIITSDASKSKILDVNVEKNNTPSVDRNIRIQRSKLLNKDQIYDVTNTTDGGLNVVVKTKSDNLIGVIKYNDHSKKWNLKLQALDPSKIKEGTEDYELYNNQQFIEDEYKQKIIDNFIPKQLQDYYTSDQYKKDTKELIKFQNKLEDEGKTLSERIAIINKSNIGPDAYLRDNFGIPFINEWTGETNDLSYNEDIAIANAEAKSQGDYYMPDPEPTAYEITWYSSEYNSEDSSED